MAVLLRDESRRWATAVRWKRAAQAVYEHCQIIGVWLVGANHVFALSGRDMLMCIFRTPMLYF